MQNKNELAPWQKADLPEPPMPRGLSWIGVCGPGVIVLGLSIGSGEFLLGPAIFVKHGLSLLWVTLVAVFFQTVFNTELMRYTVATGEPVVTGFMRTRPGKTFWAWFYALLYFLQIGWPAWAATAAGAIFFLFAGRLAAPPADATIIYLIGVVTFLACVGVLLVGKRIARTLELLNWVLVACILGSFLVLGTHLRAHRHVVFRAGRFHGLRHGARRIQLPAGASRHPAARRTGRLFGRRRRAQPHAVELGARQGLRHGQPRRAHRRGGGWREGAPGRHGFHVRGGRRQPGALAWLVAHRARRSVGHFLRGRLVRHDAAGAAVRHVRRRLAPTSRAWPSAPCWRRPSALPPVRGSEWAWRSSACGSCSRPSSTASKA